MANLSQLWENCKLFVQELMLKEHTATQETFSSQVSNYFWTLKYGHCLPHSSFNTDVNLFKCMPRFGATDKWSYI